MINGLHTSTILPLEISSRVVLCLVLGPEGYGVRQVWSEVLEGLRLRGWNIVIAVIDGGEAQNWQQDYPYARVEYLQGNKAPRRVSTGRWRKLASMTRRVGAQIKHLRWLIRLARESKASALILQSPPETLLASAVAVSVGLRVLWLVPNAIGKDVPLDLNRHIYRLLFRFGKVIPVSNSYFTDSTFGPGTFERHVVHLGVDPDRYHPNVDPTPVRKVFSIPRDAPVIGIFARMTPSKGQDRLLDALSIRDTPFHVILCGGPIESEYVLMLKDKIKALGLTDRVHLAGLQDDLRPFYASCDIVANLRVDAEPFGLTITEAMACGKPVLAHALGGPSEIVVDGITGWLLPDVEINTIATGLQKLLQNRRDWDAVGLKGRVRVLEKFRSDKFAARIAELIAE